MPIKTAATTVPPEHSLTASFTELACETWRDVWDGNQKKLVLGEESITDYHLLELSRRHPKKIKIEKFNKLAEGKRTGADWAWWFGGKGGWFGMRVQAKRLYLPSRRYEELLKANKPLSQVEKLIENAAKSDPQLFPAYCFYNGLPANHTPTWNCECLAPEPELLGCAMADAYRVKQVMAQNKDGYADIEPLSYPWHCLVACTRPKVSLTLSERARGSAVRMRGPAAIPNAEPIPPISAKPPKYVQAMLGTALNQPDVPEDLEGVLLVLESAE